MDDTAQIKVRVYDGGRRPLAASVRWMVRLSDGRQLSAREMRTYTGMSGPSRLFDVAFFDNYIFDSYTVVVSPKGFEDAGWFPVHVHPGAMETLDLMALPHDGVLNFADATWDRLAVAHPLVACAIRNGCENDAAASEKYGEVRENRTKALATFLNIVTSMEQMKLPSRRCPLDYYWNIGWPKGDATTSDWVTQLDDVFKADRFFCYVEEAFLADLRAARDQGSFEPEPNPGNYHPGATESYKQVQFDVANVQFTFHGGDTAMLQRKDGTPVKCIKIEPDIDYYKDLLSHGLLEVLPNSMRHGLTDPRVAQMLRWTAGRRAQLPDFDPMYTVEA